MVEIIVEVMSPLAPNSVVVDEVQLSYSRLLVRYRLNTKIHRLRIRYFAGSE